MTDRKEPFVCEEEPGTKALCRCGGSQNLPYCDGSHQGTELSPFIVEVNEASTVAWCGCGQSGNRPYCDGTHKTL